jgi:hypothetical protein
MRIPLYASLSLLTSDISKCQVQAVGKGAIARLTICHPLLRDA